MFRHRGVRLQPENGKFRIKAKRDVASVDLYTQLVNVVKVWIDQPDGLGHLAELREIVEPEIAAQAALRMNEGQVAKMREAFDVMNRSLREAEVFVEADLDFHRALAEAVGNPLILSLLDLIVGELREQRMRIFFVEGEPERGQHYHARILKAIEHHDAEAARTVMRYHLNRYRKILRTGEK